MKAVRAAVLVCLLPVLAACAVTDEQYPLAWEPLLPPTARDCERFAGMYADRGEAPQSRVQPSLTYGLFGHHSAWQNAHRVDFAFPDADTLQVTVRDTDKPLFTRSLSARKGEFACRDGRLDVRSRRWVAGDVMAGREDVAIEFHDAPSQLVARVRERAYGTIFAVVPIAGTATHWYRFPRIVP